MDDFRRLCESLLLSIPVVWGYAAFVLMKLWNWHVVDVINVQEITFIVSLGAFSVLRFLIVPLETLMVFINYKDLESYAPNVVIRVGTIVAVYTIILLLASIIQLIKNMG